MNEIRPVDEAGITGGACTYTKSDHDPKKNRIPAVLLSVAVKIEGA